MILYLHNVIIEQQPEAVTLHDGNIVSAVGSTAEQEEKNRLTFSIMTFKLGFDPENDWEAEKL